MPITGSAIYGAAVIETSPAIAPFSPANRSRRPRRGRENDEAGYDASRRSEIGIDQNNAHRHRVGRTTQRQLRPGIESKPAEPEDKDTQRNNQDV